ncbi:MAG TPA: DUF4430 domain-containing protein [Pirellulaceae bacterium]
MSINRRRMTRRALSLVALVLVGVGIATHDLPALTQDTAASVRLTLDYGDGVQKSFTALPWKEKMTVFDALQAAENHPRGIKLAFVGRGESVFITAIDDKANEGANGPNWRYTVNDQPARYSAGVMELKAGDAVVWRFAK